MKNRSEIGETVESGECVGVIEHRDTVPSFSRAACFANYPNNQRNSDAALIVARQIGKRHETIPHDCPAPDTVRTLQSRHEKSRGLVERGNGQKISTHVWLMGVWTGNEKKKQKEQGEFSWEANEFRW